MKILFGALLSILMISPAFAVATCNIKEYSSLAFAHNERMQVAQEPGIATQNTADFTSAPQQSNTFNPGTAYVRIWCTAQASILFGTNPTAANTDMPIAAFTTEYFGVPINQSFKLSVHSNP